MKYLKKHNEIFGLFTKKDSEITKNSMWIINPSLKLIEPTDNIYKYHVDIVDDWRNSEIKDGFNIDTLSEKNFNKWYNNDKALWIKDKPYNRSGKMVRISDNLDYIREGGKLYDFSKYFKKLKDISKQLGYNIGKNVYVKEFDKVGRIESLRESCICTINKSGDIGDVALTIYYKVSVPGESHPYGFYYNINQIEKVEKQQPLDMDTEHISDFFIDLIDNDDIKLDISLSNDENGEYLICTISYINRLQPIFNELMNNYLRLSSVMKNEYNFNTIITDISMSKLSFKIKQENETS